MASFSFFCLLSWSTLSSTSRLCLQMLASSSFITWQMQSRLSRIVNFLRQVSNSRVHIEIVNPRVFKLVLQKERKIKGLLEPAHSCYGLSLYRFLGLVEYRYSWIRFMWTFKTYGINSLLFLGNCVIRKLVRSSWWELEKRLCRLEVGWAVVIWQTVSFLLVCVRVCLWGGGWAGWP